MASFPKDSDSPYHRIVFQKRIDGKLKQKPIYFRKDKFSEKDVYDIMIELEKQQAKNQFDPWRDKVDYSDPITTDPIHTVIDHFLERRKTEISSGSMELTRYAIDHIRQILGHYPIDELTTNHIREAINQAGLKPASIQTYLSVYKKFLEFISDQYNHTVDLPSFTFAKADRNDRTEAVTEPQLFEILEAEDEYFESLAWHSRQSINRHRNCKRMLRIGFYMGLRIGELAAMRPAWIVRDGTMLRIGDLNRWKLPDSFTPKSQREYDDPIAIPPEVRDDIHQAAAECENKFDRLFGYTKKNSLYNLLTKPMKLAFPNHSLSPHSLRHGCASYWLNDRRVPVEQVQQLLRHSSINITMGYYHPDTDAHLRAFGG